MSAEYIDVAAILAGTFTTPQPTIGGRRSDGVYLLYSAAVNGLLGSPEAGKTLVASAMAADQLWSRGSVLWIDLDHNGALATIGRFRQFGIAAEVLSDTSRFRLAIPDDAEEILDLVADAGTWNPTLVIVDSIGELLPMFGANSNDADDFTRVNRQVLAAFTAHGCGVLAIDHEAKSATSSAYGATGTAAKKRAMDGAFLRVTNTRPFVPGKGGEANLSIVKDRHGALRAASPSGTREPIVATFSLSARDGASTWRFAAPEAPTDRDQSDLDALLALSPVPTSVRNVKERLGWGTTRASAAWKAFNSVPGTFPDVPGTGQEELCSSVPHPYKGNGERTSGNGVEA